MYLTYCSSADEEDEGDEGDDDENVEQPVVGKVETTNTCSGPILNTNGSSSSSSGLRVFFSNVYGDDA